MNVINPIKEKLCVAEVNGGMCGKPAKEVLNGKLSFGLPLCDPHRAELYNESDMAYRAKRAAKSEYYRDQDQHVYVVKVGDKVKIGESTDLLTRLQSLGEQYDHGEPAKILAVIDGTERTEALLHWEWQDLRVRDRFGELFRPEPELMDWIGTLGISQSAQPIVNEYNVWASDELARWGEELDRQRRRAEREAMQSMRDARETEEQRLARETRNVREVERRKAKREAERIQGRAGRLENIVRSGHY